MIRKLLLGAVATAMATSSVSAGAASSLSVVRASAASTGESELGGGNDLLLTAAIFAVTFGAILLMFELVKEDGPDSQVFIPASP